MTLRAPEGLRCEYLVNPIGIDEAEPFLTWRYAGDERGLRPTAFRVLAATRPELLVEGRADAWDTGRREYAGETGVRYAGAPLSAHAPRWWCVRWWDDEGRASAFSEPAYFEPGPMTGAEWTAPWISRQAWPIHRSKGAKLLGKRMDGWINALGMYLRGEFACATPVRRARIHLCGLGYHELHLNGRKVGDRVLEPTQTRYELRPLYVTHDVTELVEARNAIGVILGNGRHIENHGYGLPKLSLMVFIEYEDGAEEILTADRNWRVSEGPIRENGIYLGERYDARLEQPGWDLPGFDDGSWMPAERVEGVRPRAQGQPPIRITRTMTPRRIHAVGPDRFVFDFGQNFTGWVRLTVEGPRGCEVRLRHAELVNEDGTLNCSPNQDAPAEDRYVLKGEGIETWEPRFTYHGFRYVELSGYPGRPTLASLEGRFVHSDVPEVGFFETDHDLVNRIHRCIRWGQRSNLMSLPTDCPQRDERYGWLGDAHLAAEESLLNFDMSAFYAKYLEAIADDQREDGALPDTSPCYVERLYPADPAWGSAYLIIAWLCYWYHGDVGVLKRHFDRMTQYVGFLREQAGGGLLKTLGKYGDWCPPGSISPKNTPVEFTAGWYHVHDTWLLGRMARVLGRKGEAVALEAETGRLKDAFNAAWLKDGEYRGRRLGPVDRCPSQTAQVLPLHLGLPEGGDESKVLDRLIHSLDHDHGGHLDTGMLGTRHLLDVLTDRGYADRAWGIVRQRCYPGWGYMVSEGATTLWERWEKITGGGMNSQNHIMLGSVGAWFYRALAGMECLAPGWRRIRFRPHPFQDLKTVKAVLDTIRGRIEVKWWVSGRCFKITVVVPVGATAEVLLPLIGVGDTVTIREEGEIIFRGYVDRMVKSALARCKKGGPFHSPPEGEYEANDVLKNVVYRGYFANRLVMEVPSGKYRFHVQCRS